MAQRHHLILGFGYTASFLKKRILNKYPQDKVSSTSRTNESHILFDLEDPETWDSLPQADLTYWTFPAVPLDLVKEFLTKKKTHLGQIIVIGSTSGFLVNENGENVNEKSSLDLSLDRVQGEDYLRSQGSILMMASGIYGEGRNPLDWVKKNYVGKSSKIVNMIHVVDLCNFLLNASFLGKPGSLYIASDGNPQSWEEVITLWEKRGLVSQVAYKESKRISKKIDSSSSIRELNVTLQFQNFADLVL